MTFLDNIMSAFKKGGKKKPPVTDVMKSVETDQIIQPQQNKKARKASGNLYLDAKDNWLERYGCFAQQNHDLRRAVIALAVLLLISLSGNIYQSSLPKFLPWMVGINEENGEYFSAGFARTLDPQDVGSRVIKSDLTKFIKNWRSVTADQDLQDKMLQELIAYSSSATQIYLHEWFSGQNPYKRAANVLVSIQMNGVPHQVSQNAWRCEWTEIVRDRKGKTIESVRWEATLTIAFVEQETVEQIISNPLGLLVADITANPLLQQ